MRRAIAVGAMVVGLGFAGICRGGDVVLPQTLTPTNFRNTTVIGYSSPTTFVQGDSILITNAVAFTGSDTNSPVQGLDGVTVQAIFSTAQSGAASVTNDGTVISAAAGTWSCRGTVPAADPAYWQLRLVDENTNAVRYLLQMIHTAPGL